MQATEKIQTFFESFFSLLEGSGSKLVLPDFRRSEFPVQRVQFGLFAVAVKDNLAALRI